MKVQLAAAALALLMTLPAQAATYKFTPESTVTFHAYAIMRENGVHGVCRTVKGRVEVPEGNYDKAFAAVGLNLYDFEAKSGLDQHLFTAIEAPLHPGVAFVSKKFTVTSKKQEADGTHLEGTVDGVIEWHGIKHPISAPFTAVDNGKKATLDSEFWVSMEDHHVEAPTVMIITMRDKVKIDLHLVAEKQ